MTTQSSFTGTVHKRKTLVALMMLRKTIDILPTFATVNKTRYTCRVVQHTFAIVGVVCYT